METDGESTPVEPSINDLYNGLRIFERRNQCPPVIASDSHTVLFELPLPDDESIPPIPKAGEDEWNKYFVKLPCSPSNKYAEISEEGETVMKARWDLIKACLTETPIKTSHDFEDIVKSYNAKSAQKWEFLALHELFEDEFSEEDSEYFFVVILPKIIQLALRLPELIQHPIPILKKGMNHSISLSQEQCGCLLANAFLCTFPSRNKGRADTDLPEINFNRLFSIKGDNVMEKIKCILNYFKRICFVEMPTGVLTFQRRFIEKDSTPDWSKSEVKFSSIKLFVSSEGTIEDGIAMLQVDFANKYLGGGVLGWGCVQEEIRFVVNPEMIVGMLFCESMNSTEAIFMTGCEQYNKHEGYASSFKWTGNKDDVTEQDEFRRKMIYVTAIDAMAFSKPYQQFEEFLIKRDLNKAFVGFYHDPKDELSPIPVSSGNWGCGAFRGYKKLKALIQLMACCENRRNLAYFTFGEEKLKRQLDAIFKWLCMEDITVGQLWSYLQLFRGEKLSNRPEVLYAFIKKAHFRATNVEEAMELVAQIDSEDEETNEKRKIDEIEKETSEITVDEKKVVENPAKKVKMDKKVNGENSSKAEEESGAGTSSKSLKETEETEYSDEILYVEEKEDQTEEKIRIEPRNEEKSEKQQSTDNVDKFQDFSVEKTKSIRNDKESLKKSKKDSQLLENSTCQHKNIENHENSSTNLKPINTSQAATSSKLSLLDALDAGMNYNEPTDSSIKPSAPSTSKTVDDTTLTEVVVVAATPDSSPKTQKSSNTKITDFFKRNP